MIYKIVNSLIRISIIFGLVAFLNACQTPQAGTADSAANASAESAAQAQMTADGAQSTADAAMSKAGEATKAANDARRAAERAAAMAEQNQAALRALNDKIDRMFSTVSRK